MSEWRDENTNKQVMMEEGRRGDGERGGGRRGGKGGGVGGSVRGWQLAQCTSCEGHEGWAPAESVHSHSATSPQTHTFHCLILPHTPSYSLVILIIFLPHNLLYSSYITCFGLIPHAS